MEQEGAVWRRRVLACGASALGAAVAGCLGDDDRTEPGSGDPADTPDGPDDDGDSEDDDSEPAGPTYLPPEEEPDYDGWFADVPNFEGTVDERGNQLVFVNLAEGNLFAPPAIIIDPGTTVDWGWAGATGDVTVTHEGGEFDREVGDRGLELTFDEPGIFRYASEPHREEGMKGAVVVDR